MSHTFLTVAIPLERAVVEVVEQQLTEMGNPVSQAIRNQLRNKGIHFMSMSTVPASMKHGPFWIIEASADQQDVVKVIVDSLDKFLINLARTAHLVKGDDDQQSRREIESLMRRHSHEVSQGLFGTPGLCFTGTPGMSLERIRNEYELGRTVRDLLELGRFQGSPLQILQQVRKEVRQKQDLAPLLDQHDSPLLAPAAGDSLIPNIFGGVVHFTWPYLLLLLLISLLTGGIAWNRTGVFWGILAFSFVLAVGVFSLLAIAGYVYAVLRRLELTDVPDNSPPDPERLAEVVRRENKTEQNHLFGISIMKPGLVRNLVVRIVFWVIVQSATTISRPGFLGELGTIHFARWCWLPKTNYLLFFSNYGGSFESYLEDFITKAHAGLTGVWSNTVGFPRTSNVFLNGATDGDRFKRWARRQQFPTRFWYSAYPHLTTARIRLNTAIRQGLSSAATEDEAIQWLSCMGSRPRSGAIIENIDVQGILFGGFGYLNHARCLLIRLSSDVEQAKKWLAEIEPIISYGDKPPSHVARLVALTPSGLRKLGCEERAIAEFPIAFQEGMAARGPTVLSDTGEDKPAHWWWGSGEKVPDATLLVYADSAERLNDELTDRTAQLSRYGASLIHEVNLTPYDPKQPIREPFGFVDGISQPMIKGTRRWVTESDTHHVVEPGEFILGYLDNRKFLPLTPTVPATADPHNILPAYRQTEPSELPDFSQLAANGPRDLGRNGTFLVMRQLEQDVEGFNRFVKDTAAALKGRPGVPADFSADQVEHWLAAKTVGRWRDGSSLVRYPHGPGSGWDGKTPVEPDNTFLLGAEDPLGERCPFGSHIRRSNPRDSLTPNSQAQVEITNRHRILRIGRGYTSEQSTSDPTRPGLLFMCLNADIERQFEFIQQTWASARLFHGLDGEVDPLLGRGRKGGRLTIPTEEGPILIKGIKDFVTVRGGSYFFLPGRRALRFFAGRTSADPTGWNYEQVILPNNRDGFESMASADENLPPARPAWDEIH